MRWYHVCIISVRVESYVGYLSEGAALLGLSNAGWYHVWDISGRVESYTGYLRKSGIT